MKTIEFPFGKETIHLKLEQDVEVFLPVDIPGVPDELAAVQKAMSQPTGSERLIKIAQGKTTVAIVINDITRPSPTETMLTAILEELAMASIRKDQVTVIVATGNHVLPTEEELKEMTGSWYSKLKIISHNCFDESMSPYVGTTENGLPVYINKFYVQASLKIITGVIAPHQLAGFGGGRKSVVPGITGIETLVIHHSFPIHSSVSRLGILTNNVFHEEALAAARLAGVDFIVNVVKNFRGEIVDVVAGDLEQAHARGTAICEKSWVRRFDRAYDIVFVGAGHYPKDIDLHQAQKAVAVAEQITKQGGTIVLIAECRKGIGKFGNLLKTADSVDTVIQEFTKEGFSRDPNSQNSKAYLFARACKNHRVLVVTSGIDAKDLAEMFMEGFTSIAEAVHAAFLPYENPSVLCIPYASECIPVLAEHLTNSTSRSFVKTKIQGGQ